MSESIELTALLTCPRCDAPLHEFACKACQIEFPVRAGVPWLFADPETTRTEWRNRWHLALARLDQDRERVATALAGSPEPQTQLRLERLRHGYATHRNELQELLEPLGVGKGADLHTYLALRTRLPTQQGLLSYAANLFRDWSWGDAENSASLEEVRALLPDLTGLRLLVLGAGAGRLAYDLHQQAAPALTIALDNNPLLVYIAHRMAAGETVQLTEFPLAPKTPESVAVQRTLSAPQPARPGFEVVLASALRAPFAGAAFDVVVTPWLIDVVDEAPQALLPRINRLLKPDGLWLNHGSLALQHPDPAQCLLLPELEALAARCGFTGFATREADLPYMNCPESRHGRVEVVLTTCARKHREVPPPERHQALPDWLVTGRTAIPALPAFQQQAMATRIHAFIMALIDGKRSLKDVAQVMEQQQLMQQKDAETAIRGFLIKMFEEASAGGGL